MYISLIGLSLDKDEVLGKNRLVLAIINAREGIILMFSKVVITLPSLPFLKGAIFFLCD